MSALRCPRATCAAATPVPPGGHDEPIIRGDLRKGEFIAFWLKDRWNFPSYVVSKLTSQGYTMTARTREAAERQCTMFCKAMLPRLADAIKTEIAKEAAS